MRRMPSFLFDCSRYLSHGIRNNIKRVLLMISCGEPMVDGCKQTYHMYQDNRELNSDKFAVTCQRLELEHSSCESRSPPVCAADYNVEEVADFKELACVRSALGSAKGLKLESYRI